MPVPVRRLSGTEARRIAVRAQLLDAERPTDLVAMVAQLTFVQIDPTAAVAPTADLVAWSRLGSTYQPAAMQAAVEQERTLFEHASQPSKAEHEVAMVRPMADLGLYLADMAAWPESGSRQADWLEANQSFRRYVLDLLRDAGPLLSRDVPDRSDVPWPSTGWTNNRNVTQMLELLSVRGEVAVAGRIGRQRL